MYLALIADDGISGRKHNNELLAPHDRHMFLINRNFKLRINDAQLIKKEDDQGIYYQLLIKCKASLIEE